MLWHGKDRTDFKSFPVFMELALKEILKIMPYESESEYDGEQILSKMTASKLIKGLIEDCKRERKNGIK